MDERTAEVSRVLRVLHLHEAEHAKSSAAEKAERPVDPYDILGLGEQTELAAGERLPLLTRHPCLPLHLCLPLLPRHCRCVVAGCASGTDSTALLNLRMFATHGTRGRFCLPMLRNHPLCPACVRRQP
jgi:hypothetical protein